MYTINFTLETELHITPTIISIAWHSERDHTKL